ncbi:MAG: oligosaccharide flippase family protein [Candidatus Brocadiae bacterium]|nr:oligosaccharide flippase family protein [Candidatus Brocadiia bacterium]
MKERILVVGSGIFNTIMMVISGIIVTRSYSKSLLGTYQQAVLLYSTLAIFISLGTPKAVLYFVTPGSNRKKILWHILICLLVSSLIGNLALYFSWDRICSLFSNPDLQYLWLLVSCNLFFRSFNEIFQVAAVSADKKKYIWRMDTTFGSLLLLSSFYICHYHLPISSLLVANLFLELIKSSVLFYLIFHHYEGSWTGFDIDLFAKILKYSFPLLLSIFMLLFARKIDSFLVSSFMVPEVYAVYSRGALEIPFGKILIYNIAILVMPVLVQLYQKKECKEIVAIYHKEIQRSACLIVPLFFSFLLVHRDLIVFFYTEKYLESVPVFLIYLFILPIELYSFDTILQAMNKSIKVFYISCISAAIHLSISIVLIQFLGMIGPAIGALIAVVITNALYLYNINHSLGFGIKEWLPWKFLAKVFSSCFACFILFYYIAPFVQIKLFWKVGLLFGFCYLFQIFWIWKLGIINQSDKSLITETYRKLPFLRK